MPVYTLTNSLATNDNVGTEVLDEIGHGLVRRFTDELDGNSDLEDETKSAQEHVDLVAEKRERERLESFFDDPRASYSNFQRAELVRKSLQEACDQVLSKAKKKKILLRRGTSVAERVEQKISEINLVDLNSFKDIVEELRGEWERKHGKAFNCFQKVCQTLMGHKDIFAVFPSHNIYAHTLCEALTLVVQASVNHSDYAERLASSIARVSETAIDCRRYTMLIGTDEIQELFADVYQKLFSYLLEAILWYLKPARERLLDSFNSSLVERCTETVADIRAVVDRMDRQATIAMLAMNKWTISRLKEDRARSDLLEQSNADLGQRMIMLLNMMAKTALCSDQQQLLSVEPEQVGRISQQIIEQPTRQVVSRQDAQRHMQPILRSDCGNDGLSTIQSHTVRLVDPEIIGRLSRWIGASSKRQGILWILTYEHQDDGTSAPEAAALVTIMLVLHAKVPFISHICSKAEGSIEGRGAREYTGLLAMVYDLIYQLLQFRPASDDTEIPSSLLDQLDGELSSWGPSLELLGLLLRHTTAPRYCIIHGLNVLEYGSADDWCGQFLNLLVSHFESPTSSLSFLFTTSGQSLELSRRVPVTCRMLVDD